MAVTGRRPCMPCPGRGTLLHQHKGSSRAISGSCQHHSGPILTACHWVKCNGPAPGHHLLQQGQSQVSATLVVSFCKVQHIHLRISGHPIGLHLVCTGDHNQVGEKCQPPGAFQQTEDGCRDKKFLRGGDSCPPPERCGRC